MGNQILPLAEIRLDIEVISADDEQWRVARVSHGGVAGADVLARPKDVADVAELLRWASAHGVAVSVRGGGHSAWSTLEGGVLIDLSALHAVEVGVATPLGTTVHVGGGATWGQVAAALAPHELALSSGDTASVGVGGLTLGGGIGWMVRAWGLATDQLLGVQLVTAEGVIIEASDETHPELMWGLRGGGGNFGVVTRFDFAAHTLPAIAFATLSVAGDRALTLRALRDVLTDAPNELTVTYMDVPPMDPSAPAGATIGACWAGPDEAALRRHLAPLLAIEGISELDVRVRPYTEILLEMPEPEPDAAAPGFIGSNALVSELSDDIIDWLVGQRAASEATMLFLRSLGGSYSGVPSGATAWAHRSATWFAMVGGFDLPGLLDEAERARLVASAAHTDSLGLGGYGAFVATPDTSYASRRMYPQATLNRLAELKSEWDPVNIFNRNHNVSPEAAVR